jgi:hypothetical protein
VVQARRTPSDAVIATPAVHENRALTGGEAARERLEFAECRLVQIRSEKMIKSELLKDKGVLVVSPVGRLEASDFEHLAEEIDPYIEQNGRLHGLMVYTEFFPGWADFAALISHLKFVRNHQSKIEKVAAVSDSGFLRVIPSVVRHFVKAEVKHFEYHDKDKAVEWLASG